MLTLSSGWSNKKKTAAPRTVQITQLVEQKRNVMAHGNAWEEK